MTQTNDGRSREPGLRTGWPKSVLDLRIADTRKLLSRGPLQGAGESEAEILGLRFDLDQMKARRFDAAALAPALIRHNAFSQRLLGTC